MWRDPDGDAFTCGASLWSYSEPVVRVVRVQGCASVTLASAKVGLGTVAYWASDPGGSGVTSIQYLRVTVSDAQGAVVAMDSPGAVAEGGGDVVYAGSNESALFSFFGGDNWEVLIKVLDGCSVNGHVWVYGASTTDLGHVIRVTATVAGNMKEYRNEPGTPAPAMTDVTAFPGACLP